MKEIAIKRRLVVNTDESLRHLLRNSGELDIPDTATSSEKALVWQDHSSVPSLHANFAWLVKRTGDEGALATIYQDVEIYGDILFHWIVFARPNCGQGRHLSENEARGAASTMELAKRQCEHALDLRV